MHPRIQSVSRNTRYNIIYVLYIRVQVKRACNISYAVYTGIFNVPAVRTVCIKPIRALVKRCDGLLIFNFTKHNKYTPTAGTRSVPYTRVYVDSLVSVRSISTTYYIICNCRYLLLKIPTRCSSWNSYNTPRVIVKPKRVFRGNHVYKYTADNRSGTIKLQCTTFFSYILYTNNYRRMPRVST